MYAGTDGAGDALSYAPEGRAMIDHTVTRTEDDRAFLLAFADDTEDAPWMVASDRHFLGVGASHFSLKLHGGEAHPEWYVSGEIFIFYTRPDGTVGKVAPDLFVALAPTTCASRLTP